MTNTRGTTADKDKAVEYAAELLDQELAIRCKVVRKIAEEKKVSIQTARTYVREAERLLAPTFDLQESRFRWQEIDNDLKLCTVRSLEEGNLNAAVGATKARVHHFKAIREIDPAAAYDRQMAKAYAESVSEPNPNKTIPTESIMKKPDNNSVDFYNPPF